MKFATRALASLSVALILTLAACDGGAAGGAKKGTPSYNLAYSYGAQMAKAMTQMGFNDDEKNVDEFVKGFEKGLEGDSATIAENQTVLQNRMMNQTPAATPEEGAKIAYALGIGSIGNLAAEVTVPAVDFDMAALKAGFSAKLANDSLEIAEPAMDSILKAYFDPKSEEYRTVVEAKKAAAATATVEAGKAFLAENGKREGVITTESGLQYEVIKEGTGERPTPADKVKTHYHGTLVDGTVFDSSVDRGEPISFALTNVIKGWQEGIPLMTVGSKYKFYIPQDLAYGMNSPSPTIPAGAALIFEVELFEIDPEEPQAPASGQ